MGGVAGSLELVNSKNFHAADCQLRLASEQAGPGRICGSRPDDSCHHLHEAQSLLGAFLARNGGVVLLLRPAVQFAGGQDAASAAAGEISPPFRNLSTFNS